MRSRPARLALALSTGALLAGLLAAPTSATAAPAPAGDKTLDILVLGDSYSAGNGATDDQGVAQTYGPEGCLRSKVNWGEKYAAALRASGQAVRLVNHACSGGVTADFTSPRVIGTATTKVMATPAGVTTNAQGDAYLRQSDPCNTQAFPAEEFWTYQTTTVTPLLAYSCTRNLRPQADFVTPDVDLVLYTMGGNDAGFSSIVTNCFALRSATGCKAAIDAARAALPAIRVGLLNGIAAFRAHGLRDDAKMVQLGYPLLQTDNDFTLAGPPSYDVGTQVRLFGAQGNDAAAAAVPAANVGHPGQLTFLTGVPEKFAGHEPDAKMPPGNPDRWINQIGDGAESNLWYHPNRFGQGAYADLLTARGTFGAPTGPPVPTTVPPVRTKLKATFSPRRVHVGDRVRVKIKVRLSDGSRPSGRVVVRAAGRGRVSTTRIFRGDHGRTVVTFRVPRTTKIRILYRDKNAPSARVSHRVRGR